MGVLQVNLLFSLEVLHFLSVDMGYGVPLFSP